MDPQIIPLGQRGNMLLLEHAHVRCDLGRVVYEQDEAGTFKTYNIPFRNTSIILLGTGTSVTNDAARLLADSQTLIAFCGSGGIPMFSHAEPEFLPLAPDSEYRPTEYMQIWAQRFFNPDQRLTAAKELLRERYRKTKELWESLQLAQVDGFRLRPLNFILLEIDAAKTTEDLLLSEARYVKELYRVVAAENGYSHFRRDHEGGDTPNALLTHANYLAYGAAAAALHALGVSFAFPALHGKTRRGGLVFDIADLIKDGITVPLAFDCANKTLTHTQMRGKLVEIFNDHEIINYLCNQVKRILCGK